MVKTDLGKSTLAKLLSGLIKPTKGDLVIDDINTKNSKQFLNLRRKVGIVFQNPENQILFNNVYDDIFFTLKNLEIPNKEQVITNALKKVQMDEYKNQNAFELSLGQKQRVTIAGVLSINPKYIIFDEPTTMIDSEGKEDLYVIISQLKNQGYTIIYVTNALDEILISDRILIINNGKIDSEIKTSEILDKKDIFIKNGIKLPKIVQLLLLLKEKNVNIELDTWTIEELSEKIIKEITK